MNKSNTENLTQAIYHGTVQQGLKTIKPFKRYTPGGADIADSIPPRIYATFEPAYAVAHSFPWSTDDGVDIAIKAGVVTILIPEHKRSVLEQPVCIYSLPSDTFVFTKEEETGLTYHSDTEVTVIRSQCFGSVSEAMENFGGKIKFI